MNLAYACSPTVPVSEEIVTDIKILSDKDYNSEYSAGSNLIELFDLVVLYQNSEYQRYDIDVFLSSKLNVPDEIFLLPKSAPETTEAIQFTIHIPKMG
ncbi:MAG: hypothetical protein BalsKO_28280 [Balneolaceae bacterium]